jgi:hypothetical protein
MLGDNMLVLVRVCEVIGQNPTKNTTGIFSARKARNAINQTTYSREEAAAD